MTTSIESIFVQKVDIKNGEKAVQGGYYIT